MVGLKRRLHEIMLKLITAIAALVCVVLVIAAVIWASVLIASSRIRERAQRAVPATSNGQLR